MATSTDFYIDGEWVSPVGRSQLGVVNPATENVVAQITLGDGGDVDLAVSAARAAFEHWGTTSAPQRAELLTELAAVYSARVDEMAEAISTEMGAPIDLARESQASAGAFHLKSFVRSLERMSFDEPLREDRPEHRIYREPMGVAALITPWNWPMNQVTLKVGAALAAGCTMVLKPSEVAPLSSLLFAEFIDEVGFPNGVFNLVNGDGPGVGSALTAHPDVDVVSFTGSTRAGKAVTVAAADSVKRVSLELGGKSPNLVFADSDVDSAVRGGLQHCFENTGQSCNAPTRLLVERDAYDHVVTLAQHVAEQTTVGDPVDGGDHIGPLASQAQYSKVQGLIDQGIAEGARLVAGGPGRPDGFATGYYVKPTVFADVDNDMTIAREEIFGPVVVIIPFDDENEAIQIANDTPYGLAAYVHTGDPERAARVSHRLRAGMVQINGTSRASGSPFGGYKQSGVGREGGVYGIEEFLEIKSVSGVS